MQAKGPFCLLIHNEVQINDCTMTWKKCLYCIAKLHYSPNNGNVRRLGVKGLLENVVGNGENASK